MGRFKPPLLDQRSEDRIRRLASHAEAQRTFHARVRASQAVREAGLAAGPSVQLEPVDFDGTTNALRPGSFGEMVGQELLKPLLRRLVARCHADGRRLPHLLLVGASGTGKTTAAIVVARELNTRVFALKAPVDMATLEALRTTAQDGDVVFVDEIHMQVNGDRRGITQACDPESFYLLLEDGVLAGPRGRLPFPDVTWIGATTDVGLLPEPLSNRFPLAPRLQPYTEADMVLLACANAHSLNLRLEAGAGTIFAQACRLNPRQLNSYIRNAEALGGQDVTCSLATEVVTDLCGCTLDGLTDSMQTVLRFLYAHCGRISKGEQTYSASVGALATACGHGRDTKAVSLLVEPWLIQRGLLSVRPGTGRMLTPAGVQRAKELT
jgi:holliday junction DNA helicase RuvB